MPVDEKDYVEINSMALKLRDELQGRGFPTFIDPQYVSDWEGMNIKPVLSCGEDLEFEGECILDPNRVRKLLAMDTTCNVEIKPMSMSFKCNSPFRVPVRKHRKKRIAKKWAKKYGYRYEFRDVHFEELAFIHTDDEIDVLGKEFVVR